MKLSAQEEYGLRCLLYMARHGETQSHSIPEISKSEGLSVPNVAKLMRILRLGGLVASVRGQAGGYTLSRPSDQVTVSEVLSLLGGNFFNPHFCDRHSGLERTCSHSGNCSLRLLWGTVQKNLDSILTKTTLRDMLREEEDMRCFLKGIASSAPVESPSVVGVNGH